MPRIKPLCALLGTHKLIYMYNEFHRVVIDSKLPVLKIFQENFMTDDDRQRTTNCLTPLVHTRLGVRMKEHVKMESLKSNQTR